MKKVRQDESNILHRLRSILEDSDFVQIKMKKVRQDESNILHRLRSILEDSDFVQSIQNAYLSKSYPTFANLRCGAWYSPCFDGECYFKSTDGHYGTWDCNFSRLN
eukprot:PhF_6_TR29285/c0_g1_i2/m.42913